MHVFQPLGVHIFPSVHTVRDKTSNLVYDYVCGTVKVDGDPVSFIRITNIQHVIESSFRVLHKHKRMVQYGNIPAGEAWVVRTSPLLPHQAPLISKHFVCFMRRISNVYVRYWV